MLNPGISEEEIENFEKSYNINLPYYYREWLKINNGGELFTIPAGTILGEILGNREKRNGIPYLEYNFDNKKRWPGMPNYLFIVADTSDGDVIGYDLNNTNNLDGRIISWSHENGEVDEEWDSLGEWLNDIMVCGKMLVNYDGNENE